VLRDDLAVDESATATAREQLAAIERPLFEPSTPSASTWVERQLREGDVYLLNPQ
jgi:N-methylhydantoinase B